MEDVNVLYTWLRSFIPGPTSSNDITLFLGFGFIVMISSCGVGAIIFETKKQRPWIGIIIGIVPGIVGVLSSVILLPLPQFEAMDQGYAILGAIFLSGAVVIAMFGAVLWAFVPERSRQRATPKNKQPKAYDEYITNALLLRLKVNQMPIADVDRMKQVELFKKPISKLVPDKDSIFISYRQLDSADVVGRIYDKLTQHFGKEAVFKDVDSIPLGYDFRTHLQQVVGSCGVLLVVIGDSWLTVTDDEGHIRLNNADDYVRIEVSTALLRNVPVIPLLVKNAKMPKKSDLPDDIANLSFRNGTHIRNDPDFHFDMDRVIQSLSSHVNIN